MTLGEHFCRRLVDAMPTLQAKTACMMELQKWGGKTLYLPAQKRGPRRVTAAANMLANQMTKGDAAQAIHERFGVSMRQAQRDVKAACQKSPESVAPAA
jgi:Mor family transcriptional regulator